MKSKKEVEMKCEDCCHHTKPSSNTGNSVYGLGMLGTAFYFLQHASNFTDVIMAIIQAIFWPAILVYHALTLLKL